MINLFAFRQLLSQLLQSRYMPTSDSRLFQLEPDVGDQLLLYPSQYFGVTFGDDHRMLKLGR